MQIRVQVWDRAIRAYHWLLVLALPASWLTAEAGGLAMDWHQGIGALVLGLLVFRLVWGFIGSAHARFAEFFPTPGRLSAYWRGAWQGHGHTPLGALSVCALLGLLGLQVGTGLFANDDIAFQGPLTAWVDKSLSDSLSGWHALLFNVLLGLVVLHVAAIVFYWRIRKQNLLAPMLTGEKTVAAPVLENSPRHGLARFVLAAAAAGTLVWGIFALEPPPAAPAPATVPAATPAW